ncbi:MAG TPA: HPr family phosphocarrier protein [Lachnospiraceae bacterium]|nr:HPr family phosphocarrier protein [Lachnospiraceae bacterium]HPF29190.1 HPr family phosphocarrier protein [Lachnospiraceae bacterium]
MEKQSYQKRIRLAMDEVNEFVMVAAQCPFDVSISNNHYVADAKSMFEVIGLDFSKILTLEYNGYDSIFEVFLKRFDIAS